MKKSIKNFGDESRLSISALSNNKNDGNNSVRVISIINC